MKMDREEYLYTVRKKVIEAAESMIAGNLDLVKGCRIISDASREITSVDEKLFHPIIGVASETDIYPIEDEVRARFETNYLRSLDEKRVNYTERVRASVLEDCTKIIEALRVMKQ